MDTGWLWDVANGSVGFQSDPDASAVPPEAFGLMALVGVFMQGLQMFSDVGIGPSIIQNKRGDDPEFLNTAWTIQVMRGCLLWLGACALAVPAAWLYRQPMLISLLPVAGLAAIIAGLTPTKQFTAQHHLTIGRLTFLEFASQVLGIATTILLAWALRSVWAFIGSLLGTAVKVVLTQLDYAGPANGFNWDRDARKSLFRFGKWIFLSTAATFLANNLDKLTLAALVPASH